MIFQHSEVSHYAKDSAVFLVSTAEFIFLGGILCEHKGGIYLSTIGERINLALFNLPVEQREVVTLKIWEDFTFREISQVLKVSPDTCASRYRYGLEKLRMELRI